MRKTLYCLTAIILILSCSCCKTSKKNVKAGKFPLVGTQWMLVALENEEINKDFALHPFIVFDTAGAFHGNLGCNTFFGTYEITKKQKMRLQFDGATKRLCSKMEVERRFLVILKRDVTRYELHDNELILFSEERELMRFKGVNLEEVE
ncbi:MAG: META domain-containing protein [Bacteroidales bacterium]|nr:META domain-containing protein [Bacteroidales bacterium]